MDFYHLYERYEQKQNFDYKWSPTGIYLLHISVNDHDFSNMVQTRQVTSSIKPVNDKENDPFQYLSTKLK